MAIKDLDNKGFTYGDYLKFKNDEINDKIKVNIFNNLEIDFNSII